MTKILEADDRDKHYKEFIKKWVKIQEKGIDEFEDVDKTKKKGKKRR